MKIYADPKLPLRPETASDKFLLYTFERREKWLNLKLVGLFVMLGFWIFSQFWLFGVLTAFALLNIYLSLESRAVCRMIRRVWMYPTQPADSTAQQMSDGNAEKPPGV